MAPGKDGRRLVVNADDFGNSESINTAVIEAHERGILTTASLMVNGSAFAQAVHLAKKNAQLGVGLHLTLCCGTATLPPERIPSLVDERGRFSDSPVSAGMNYFFSRSARAELDLEIEAQFQKFADTGLVLDHVNGHLHFHLHPAVFEILRPKLKKWKVRAVRLTRDPASIDWPLGSGRWFYRASHAVIFGALSKRAAQVLDRERIAHTEWVFGLLENARVDTAYLLKLARKLPPGDSELYSHPSLDEFRHEYEALVSSEVADALRQQKVQLIRYQDLWHG